MEQVERPAPGQTIVIQQRERVGWGRRILSLLFLGFLLFLLFGSMLTRDQGFPTKLAERYVTGEFTGAKIAVVEVNGALFDDEVEHVLKQVRQARSDDLVKAIILRIDSPGGTVSGADRVWREVEMVKKAGKPVVASFGGMAASGGYYVAAPADHILAEPTTLTGSIGVIMELPQVEGLLDKVGVKFETITTGPWKDSLSPFRPMSPAERERWHTVIDSAYLRFVNIVARGRNLPLAEARKLADGKVYTADEALQLRLVNELGYLDDAILVAQKLAKLGSSHVIKYAKPLSLTDALLSMSAQRPGWALGPETLLKVTAPRLMYLAR